MTSVGRNEGLKIVEMSLDFYKGTARTHTTLQVSQSLFDSAVTEISAKNEIPIQSLFKILFRNDISGYETHFEHGSPVQIRNRTLCILLFHGSRQTGAERLLFFDLYFWRNCYVTSVAFDNKKLLCN